MCKRHVKLSQNNVNKLLSFSHLRGVLFRGRVMHARRKNICGVVFHENCLENLQGTQHARFVNYFDSSALLTFLTSCLALRVETV